MGYTNVKDYEEGKSDWMDAGLLVERERAESLRGRRYEACYGNLGIASANVHGENRR